MAFNPKDAVDAVKDIATNAVEKASDIVENASDIIRGDLTGGVSGIVAEFHRHRHLRRGPNQGSLYRREVRSRRRVVAVRRWRPR